ncbi:MAG: DUF1493 family protein [Bacteroidota bacterium]
MNSDDLLYKIIEFTRKETFSPNILMSRETRLKADLGIDGADGLEFIVSFSKQFNVDVSGFKSDKYFDWEGNQFLTVIFGLKNNSLLDITLGDLEKAIVYGKLDDTVLG